jgi:hypothetical protein
MPVYPDIEINGHNLIALMRGNAMEAYSQFETSLARVFVESLGADQAKAAIVFCKIVNTRSRMSIIEKLIKKTAKTNSTNFGTL